MPTHDHDHDWQRLAAERHTYFVDEPNSKRRSRPVSWVICIGCGQRGFRYAASRVVYVCDRVAANWLEVL